MALNGLALFQRPVCRRLQPFSQIKLLAVAVIGIAFACKGASFAHGPSALGDGVTLRLGQGCERKIPQHFTSQRRPPTSQKSLGSKGDLVFCIAYAASLCALSVKALHKRSQQSDAWRMKDGRRLVRCTACFPSSVPLVPVCPQTLGADPSSTMHALGSEPQLLQSESLCTDYITASEGPHVAAVKQPIVIERRCEQQLDTLAEVAGSAPACLVNRVRTALRVQKAWRSHCRAERARRRSTGSEHAARRRTGAKLQKASRIMHERLPDSYDSSRLRTKVQAGLQTPAGRSCERRREQKGPSASTGTTSSSVVCVRGCLLLCLRSEHNRERGHHLSHCALDS